MDEDWRAVDLEAIEARRQKMLSALGLVVDGAALMEQQLRVLFCALMETRLATVVAARQTAKWLIENCDALAKANVITGGLDRDQADSVHDALMRCQDASRERNKLIHGMWSQYGAKFMQAETKWRSHELTWSPRTPEDVEAVAELLGEAAIGVMNAITIYLGPSRRDLESALRDMPGLTLNDAAAE
jgi:post-segregation antitoxin (ccd killing protein)